MQFRQLPILRPKIVTPFADTMRLVDGDLDSVPAFGVLEKMFKHQPLRRDIKQPVFAAMKSAQPPSSLRRVERRIQKRRCDPARLQRIDLVFHQRNQRGHHDR